MKKLNIAKITTISFFTCLTSISCKQLSNEVTNDESVRSSKKFPTVDEAYEFCLLSAAVEWLHSCEDIEDSSVFPVGAECQFYEKTDIGTEVMVVTSVEKEYIGVVFAGTNEMEDWIFNLDIKQVPFGPSGDPIAENIYVHVGFNDALFYDGLFDSLLAEVKKHHSDHPNWQIYTSGHSAGGALSMFMAAGISYYMPSVSITNPSYASCVCGDESWVKYFNNNPRISSWRFVNDDDIVPRLQLATKYMHTGHTIQLNPSNVVAFYLHYGDESNGYAGVPPTWNLRGFDNPQKGISDHYIEEYVKYIQSKSLLNSDQYYTDKFVACSSTTCPDEYDDDGKIAIS